MLVEKIAFKNLYCITLNPNDDILFRLREAVEKEGIKNAVIVTGAGSAACHHFHVVGMTERIYTKGEGASDIVNINGLIVNGRVHAHITHSNKDVAYGGHLEEGVKVLTFATIVLAEVDHDLNKYDSQGRRDILKAAGKPSTMRFVDIPE